jgi:hypothetical protein
MEYDENGNCAECHREFDYTGGFQPHAKGCPYKHEEPVFMDFDIQKDDKKG